MRNIYLCGCLIIAAGWMLASFAASHAVAQPPLSKGKHCICAPNSQSYGYYPAKWRRWPDQGMFGMPTPAMMPHEGEPERLPELLPPTNQDAPSDLPQGPTAPPGELPSDLPEGPSLDEPAATPPPAEPEAQPAAPSLPPAAPGALPEDPLAPPAELDDDPVPALPQSLLEPAGEAVPRISQGPNNASPTRYQAPADSTMEDETGLLTLPLAEDSNRPANVKFLPQVEPVQPQDSAPELLEPSPSAQPVEAGETGDWTRHRQNPLRGAAGSHSEVQQATHWEAPAPAKPAVQRSPTPAPSYAPRPRVAAPQATRSNPLRGGAAGQ